MSDVLIYGSAVLCGLLLGAVFFGAPYVPTLSRDVRKVFDILKPQDVLVDLGSGDGRLVRAAATRGIKAYGIELSPLLALFSWLTLGRLRANAHIRCGNYWNADLPRDTTTVFVFLADRYMEKLRRYLETQASSLRRPLTLISYGFPLPGYEPIRTHGPLLVYLIKP